MRNSVLHLGACLMLLLVTACSNGSKMSDLLKKVPAETDMVVIGNVKTIIESLGGSVEGSSITLPSYINNELSESDADAYDNAKSFLKNSGINMDACAMMMDYNDGHPIVVFSLDDSKQFIRTIEDEGYREKDEEDGVVFYSKKVYESSYDSDYDNYGYVAIKDNYAYWIDSVWKGSDFKPMKALSNLIADASEKSFVKTKFCDYITSGNAAGAAFKLPRELRREMRDAGLPREIADIYEGVICLKGDLTNNEATITAKWLDEDGETKDFGMFNKYVNTKAKINPQVLSYMNKDDSFVYAVSMKDVDWDGYMDMIAETTRVSRSDKSVMTIVKSYLEKLDGTVAVGIGVTNGLESLAKIEQGRNVFNEFSMTVVCETKQGKAKGIINDMKGLLDSEHIEYNDKSNGFSLNIPGEDAILYVEANDDVVVLSNQSIKKGNNATVNNMNFGDYIAVAGIVLNKSNQLMRDLNVGHGMKMSLAFDAENVEGTLNFAIGGSEQQGVIEKLTRIILDLVSREKELTKKWRDFRPEYNDYEIDESFYADSIAVFE